MKKRKTWLAAVGVGLLVWPVILAGCNGDNHSGGPIFGVTPTPTAPMFPGLFQGSYSGVFQGGASGVVNFFVNENGRITASVESSTLRSGVTAAAIFNGSGSVNSNGNFSFSVRVGTQTVTFRGRLVEPGGNTVSVDGSYTSTSGQSGTFSVTRIGAAPTPTATSPGGSATPTPTTGGGTGACTTGTGNATFSSVAAPIISTPFSSACANGAIVSAGGRPVSVTVAFADAQSGKARALTFTVSDFVGGITAGKSFTIGGTNVATYNQSTVGGGAITQWMGTGGTFRINTLQGNNASVTLTNVRFGPGRAVGGIIAGTGTFTVNGSATVTLTPR